MIIQHRHTAASRLTFAECVCLFLSWWVSKVSRVKQGGGGGGGEGHLELSDGYRLPRHGLLSTHTNTDTHTPNWTGPHGWWRRAALCDFLITVKTPIDKIQFNYIIIHSITILSTAVFSESHSNTKSKVAKISDGAAWSEISRMFHLFWVSSCFM